MNVELLKKAIKVLREDLGDALVSTVIWKTETGISIAGYNDNPKGPAFFGQMTKYIQNALKGAQYPGLKDYYMLDLVNGKLAVILQLEGGYQWGILVDRDKANMGIILSIAVPDAMEAFKKALEG